ncbi:unnamed protein product [marine sediment metagenome]|uniref:Uncharacterized protein n=1 Tax=marine sediment metagenome TaxID=412755 RepID=X1G136_9ZZZZ
MKEPKIIKVPRITFRGRKIYLESTDEGEDECAAKHFANWGEDYMKSLVKGRVFIVKK